MGKFAIDLTKALDKIKEQKDQKIRGTLLGLSSRIIKSTPVGNPDLWESKPPKGYIGGTLRGAWNASATRPDSTKRESTDKNGAATINAASQVLKSFPMGENFYLNNPQPYAFRVEYGWSRKQRPEGMVRVNVAQTQQILDRL